MEQQLWAIAVKADSSESELKQRTAALCNIFRFNVPKEQLRVGTLDSLMSLSDDLIKMDMLSESTVLKIYAQLFTLKEEEPTVLGVDVETYATKQWEWDEAKFQMKTPLRELSESIAARIGSLDEELKVKMSELNGLKSALQTYERKQQGNLLVRSLTEIVKEENMIASEYMTTVLVVVPRNSFKEWYAGYETLAQFVVPKSANLLSEDNEYGLFAVTVFKKYLDNFKAAAREKKYTVRDFVYEPTKLQDELAKRDGELTEYERLKAMLSNWCQINFAEAFNMVLHLKAIRIFTESVLRYGLTSTYSGMRPNFSSYIVQPKRGKADALKKLLCSLYGGSGAALMSEEESESSVPGAGGGMFYPFVFCTIETAPAAL